MKPAGPARLLGAATALYGAAVLLRPEILLRPTGLGTGAEPGLRATARMIALRDLISGLAWAVASTPRARRAAAAIRVGSDAADTVVLGLALRGRAERGKTLAVTSSWGLLCAAAALHEVRRDPGRRGRAGARRP
ncbi:hypothetical protein [Nocardia tengchongensis]|uniref:hypothetical protein n=1 Tax=Nocardia tengchongensis TaxID=2055889 RepID=UPI0036204968